MNMKKKISLTLALAIISTTGALTCKCTERKEQQPTRSQRNVPEIMASGIVVDEEGKPVENARVTFCYISDPDARPDSTFVVFTDAKGAFSGRAHSLWGRFNAGTRKDGYYGTHIPIPRPTDIDEKKNRWLPWNPTVKAILRPIKNPIPMYERLQDGKVPVNDQPCGYDLFKGDWVAPWGEGEVADFIFTSHCEYTDHSTSKTTCKLTFSNPLDGFHEVLLPEAWKHSSFKWYYEVPDGNFAPEYSMYQIRDFNQGNKTNWKENTSCYFRIRSKSNGKAITQAYYGKIAGSIGVGQHVKPGNCNFAFKYFLNPTSLDRNMEDDEKKKIFIKTSKEKAAEEEKAKPKPKKKIKKPKKKPEKKTPVEKTP
jgi:hypothetical protein